MTATRKTVRAHRLYEGVAWCVRKPGQPYGVHSEGWRYLSHEVGDDRARTLCQHCDACTEPQEALDAVCALLRLRQNRNPSDMFAAAMELLGKLPRVAQGAST